MHITNVVDKTKDDLKDNGIVKDISQNCHQRNKDIHNNIQSLSEFKCQDEINSNNQVNEKDSIKCKNDCKNHNGRTQIMRLSFDKTIMDPVNC